MWRQGKFFLAGVDDVALLGVDVFAAEMESFGNGGGERAFDFDGDAVACAGFDDQIDFGAGGGAVEPRVRAFRQNRQKIFEDESFPA